MPCGCHAPAGPPSWCQRRRKVPNPISTNPDRAAQVNPASGGGPRLLDARPFECSPEGDRDWPQGGRTSEPGAAWTSARLAPPRGCTAASTFNEGGLMRTVLAIVMVVSLVAGTLSVASAADETKANSQQERMKACNAQAGDKKGDERKAFMSTCLKGKGEAMPMTQQEKMKKCNADASAKALKGDDRKAFMSECLKAGHKM